MTTENAIAWLRRKKFTRWRLFKGETEKVDEFDEDETDATPEEAAEELEEVLSLLTPGAYVLKGWKGKGRQAAQSVFRFTSAKPSMHHQSNQHSNNLDIQDIIRKAEEAAYTKLEAENWRKKVDERLDNIETLLKKLTDDDDDNDEDAIEKFTERVPQIANAFSSVKSLLKTTN